LGGLGTDKFLGCKPRRAWRNNAGELASVSVYCIFVYLGALDRADTKGHLWGTLSTSKRSSGRWY